MSFQQQKHSNMAQNDTLCICYLRLPEGQSEMEREKQGSFMMCINSQDVKAQNQKYSVHHKLLKGEKNYPIK